jgi:hypothetical protein
LLMTVSTLRSADENRHFVNVVSYVSYRRGLNESKIKLQYFYKLTKFISHIAICLLVGVKWRVKIACAIERSHSVVCDDLVCWDVTLYCWENNSPISK